jgi:hypothetical protein
MMPLTFLFGMISVAEASAQNQPEKNAQDARMNYFYNSLKPYGEWTYTSTYGWCWYPYNITVDWRPYTEGNWVYTDAGWTFDSDAPYGWATFHYGRWFFDNDQGWLWYPDTVWAPCWVAWRYDNNHIGWAPLTPDCLWKDGTGLELGNFNPDNIPLNYYTFCHIKDFAGKDLIDHELLIAKNATYIKKTHYMPGTLRYSNNAVANEFSFQDAIVKAMGHDIPRLKMMSADSPQNHGSSGNEYRTFRPEITYKNQSIPLFTGQKPKNLENQHNQELQALTTYQKNRQNLLEQDHTTENRNPPDNVSREQLTNQHQIELKAQQEQVQREQHLLQSEQQRETHTAVAPNAPPPKHYVVPAQRQPQPKKQSSPQQQQPASGDQPPNTNDDYDGKKPH